MSGEAQENSVASGPPVPKESTEEGAAKKLTTAPNGAPLSKVEQAIISYSDQIEGEHFVAVAGKTKTLLPDGVEFDPVVDEHFNLYTQVNESPEFQKSTERVERLRSISHGVTKRADILHRLNNLAREQAKLELEEGRNDDQTERIEKEVQNLEEDLSRIEENLVRGIEDLAAQETQEIPELTEFASEIKQSADVKPDVVVDQAQAAIQEFDSSFGKALREEERHIHGHKLIPVEDLKERYDKIGRVVREASRQFSHPFSSNISRRAVLTKRLETARIGLKSIEAEYRARNTFNGILFLEEIGSGALGVIRRAKVKGGVPGLRGESATQEEVEIAVKRPIPPKDGTLSTKKSFQREEERVVDEGNFLDELRLRQGEIFPTSLSHFPDSTLIQLVDGTQALALEFMPHGNQLPRLCKPPQITPDQLYEAMIKHFEVLVVVHSLGYNMAEDKKLTDFYYFPKTGRYVVLDWNIEVPMKREDLAASRAGNRRFNLRTSLEDFLALNHRLSETTTGFSPGMVRKLELLSKRSAGRMDATTAKDVIELLKNINNLSDDEMM